MQTKRSRDMMRAAARTAVVVGAGVTALLLTACNGNPSPGSTAYKEGKLGNGSFLFRCDDSVACDRWSTGDAKDFPTQIAAGSNFELRFVADGQQGGSLLIHNKRYDGVTLQEVAPYVGRGTNGFAALKPGFGTVVARAATGAIIDYVQLRIVQPDGLVVYDADYKGSSPTKLQAITMTAGERRSFRTVAEYKQQAIAGAIPVEWTSDDDAVVQVESYTGGVVTVVAKQAAGATKLKAVGAALTKEIEVEVQP